jgi:hypothetical protein
LRRRQEQIIGSGNRLFGETLLDQMLTGQRPAAVDVVLKSELGAPEELWLEEGGDQLALGPSARPLQRLLEFLFKSSGEQREDLLIALRAPLPFAKTLAFGTLVSVGDMRDAAPHPRYDDVMRQIGDQNAAAITRALQEADRSGNLVEYLVALQGCGHRAHPKLTENIWPLDDIWSVQRLCRACSGIDEIRRGKHPTGCSPSSFRAPICIASAHSAVFSSPTPTSCASGSPMVGLLWPVISSRYR